MKTFNDLKIGDKIYFVDFNLEEGLASAYAAEVISLKRISEETIKITCRHQTFPPAVCSAAGKHPAGH